MDYNTWKWILHLVNATGKLARWRLRLSEFEFDVVQRTSIRDQAADTLLRLETGGTDTIRIFFDLLEMMETLVK